MLTDRKTGGALETFIFGADKNKPDRVIDAGASLSSTLSDILLMPYLVVASWTQVRPYLVPYTPSSPIHHISRPLQSAWNSWSTA